MQDSQIKSVKIIGQVGIEVAERVALFEGHKLELRILNANWSDARHVASRVVSPHLVTLSPLGYSIETDHIKQSCPLIEYIVSPLKVNMATFPLTVWYQASHVDNLSFFLQVKYQVHPDWASPLQDVTILVKIDDPSVQVLQSNLAPQVSSGELTWKTAKLLASQQGVIEVQLKVQGTKLSDVAQAPINSLRVSFKSLVTLTQNINLSETAAELLWQDQKAQASLRLMTDITISPNTVLG
jgi:hypothetical protein